ncbi:MAG: hypothetical protein WC455_23795 [Dehalococcoidia bacterium]|jgi:hypothetical protein
MKDYDAIADEIPLIYSEGWNDWPNGEIKRRIDIKNWRRRITAILRKHDEAEAGGELPDAEGEIDSYIDMGAFRDPKVARPYLIDGYRLGYGAGKQYARSQMRPALTDEKALREALFGIVNGYHDNGKYHWMLRADQVEQIMAEIDALLAREAPKEQA